jgi:hypothetical protein
MSETLVMERVQANLGRLKLEKAGLLLPDLLKTAEEGSKSHLSFLDDLLEEEVSQKSSGG